MKPHRARHLLVGLTLCLAAAGCAKQGAKTPSALPVSELAPSVPPPGAKVTRYQIDAKGRTSIDMPAPQQHIKAETTAAAGALEIDLGHLASSRGEVKIDLASLATHTFGTADDAQQTHHSHNWLQIGDDVAPALRARYRWAVFAIRSIDGLSAPAASAIPPRREGGEELRTVSLTAHGELLLHGHKVPRDVALMATLHYPAGAPADFAPTRIEIRTRQPLQVVLADHDVKPRDSFGKLAQEAFFLLGTKVADVASVSFDLTATR